jgi:hypothetical protein
VYENPACWVNVTVVPKGILDGKLLPAGVEICISAVPLSKIE